MPKIGDAPSGEKTVLDGTEKIPMTGSVWVYISTVRTFVKSLTDTLYSAYNHTHADSDNGGVVNHTVLTNAGTSIHLPAYSSDSTTYLDGNGNWTVPPGGLSSVYDSDILFTDITAGNASISQHGFLPKLSGDSNTYLNGDGEYTAPPSLSATHYRQFVWADDSDTGWAFVSSGGQPVLNLEPLE